MRKIISEEGYRDDPIGVETIQKLKQKLCNAGHLRKLLGFIGDYRPSIHDFSRKAKPLYDLLSTPVTTKSKQNNFSKKSKGQKPSSEPINWINEHQSILENLIETLKSPKFMACQDFSLSFIVHCDASESCLGAVFCKKQNNKMKVVSYASHTVTPAEKNYHLHSDKIRFLGNNRQI